MMFKINVLAICVCYQIYFRIDHHCKTQSEFSDFLEKREFIELPIGRYSTFVHTQNRYSGGLPFLSL